MDCSCLNYLSMHVRLALCKSDVPADGDELLDFVHLFSRRDDNQGDSPKHLIESLQGVGELAVREQFVGLLQGLAHAI